MSNYIKQTWVTGDTVQANGPSNNLNHIEDGIANIVESSDSNLSNLNVLVIGDSIAAGQHVSSENKWTTLLANEYNWTLTNKAVPGVPLSDYYNREHSTSEQSIVRQIDYIAQMQTKPDLVICWGGHNDQGGTYRPSPLGSFNDVATQDTAGVLPTYADTYSLMGSIRYICEVVHNYAPKAAIVFLSTEYMSNRPYNITVPSGTTDKSYQFKQGLLIGQDDYGYSVINMAACGICPSTLSLYTSDNVHPNAAGCILIKDYLKFKLPKEVYLIN